MISPSDYSSVRNTYQNGRSTLMGLIDYIKKNQNSAFTENGAYSYNTSESECLDLFYRIGALRNSASDNEINTLVERAYAENPLDTMKILFFARDIRNGLGERRVFRTAVEYLAACHTESVRKNLELFSEYGRWDDLVMLYGKSSLDSFIIDIIKKQLESDIINMNSGKTVSLLAKWLPSVNTSSEKTRILAGKIVHALGFTEKHYRKTLSSLRKYIDIIENRLRERDYTFDYSKQPSGAMMLYRKAFIRNDGERYMQYIENVHSGKEKLNVSSLYPYDIVRKALSGKISAEETSALDAAWKSMNDISSSERNAIAVIDGSGSMYGCYSSASPKPFEAALSLGLYFAEKSHGRFANHFITFSETPRLIEIKGRNIVEKARYAESFNEIANTDIYAVFRLILDTALEYNLPQSELPDTIYIISDMEFDSCAEYNGKRCTNFQAAEHLFRKAGYKLPDIVFWNVASRNQQIPVKAHQSGAVLVSGSSPKIFDMVKSGDINPFKLMRDIIDSERYSAVSA